MSRYMDNFCVGCPQGCINCGRKQDVMVIECDRCGEAWQDDYYENKYGYEDLCVDCYKSLSEQEDEGFFDRCECCKYLDEDNDICTKYNKKVLDIYNCEERVLL